MDPVISEQCYTRPLTLGGQEIPKRVLWQAMKPR